MQYDQKSKPAIGSFLVALPGMADARFEKSVIYLCSHTDSGAMGLIVNRPWERLNFTDLCDQLDITKTTTQDIPILFGGPVEHNRGFVLHSSDYNPNKPATDVGNDLQMSATVEIIEDIAANRGPKNAVLMMGYAGWDEGQLEQEIENNAWLVVETDPDVLFQLDRDVMWEQAMILAGVSPLLLAEPLGYA